MQRMGEFIRSRRRELNMTQEQLAQRVNMDQSYIVRLENGKQTGSLKSLINVALALNTRPGVIVDIMADTLPPEEMPGSSVALPEYFVPQDRQQVEQFVRFLTFVHKADTNMNEDDKKLLDEALRRSNERLKQDIDQNLKERETKKKQAEVQSVSNSENRLKSQ